MSNLGTSSHPYFKQRKGFGLFFPAAMSKASQSIRWVPPPAFFSDPKICVDFIWVWDIFLESTQDQYCTMNMKMSMYTHTYLSVGPDNDLQNITNT